MVGMPSKMEFSGQLRTTTINRTPACNNIGNTSSDQFEALCAAVNSRYFNQINRGRLGKDVILTSFSKSPEILFQSTKMILMFLLFEQYIWCLGIHTFLTFRL